MHILKQTFSLFLLAFALTVPLPALSQDSPVESPIDHAVNINQASATEIADALNGIGVKRAHAIVSFRDQYGPFQSLEDIAEIKGVGFKTLDKNRNRISFE